MQPVSFNTEDARAVIYAKDQPEYNPLPVIKWNDGTVVSKWKLTWKEIFKVIFSRHIFLSVATFNEPLQPVRISLEEPEETNK